MKSKSSKLNFRSCKKKNLKWPGKVLENDLRNKSWKVLDFDFAVSVATLTRFHDFHFLYSDAVVRSVYYKYFHPKEALVSNGVLNRAISRAAGKFVPGLDDDVDKDSGLNPIAQ